MPAGLGHCVPSRCPVVDLEGLPVTLLATPSGDTAVPLTSFSVRTNSRFIAPPRHATAAEAGYLTSAFIAIGILISIVTTPDPLWWHLHFSRLGTFAVFSGFAFNATIVISGALVVYFATRLRAEMVRHAGTAVLSNRRAATVVPLLVGVIGVHLSMVGIFPLNVNEFMHDRGPQGALLAFLGILASRRWVLRGMHRAVAKTTRRVGITLSGTIIGFATGILNLAAFELLVFSLMFLWFLMLARNIGRPVAAPVPPRAPQRRTRAPRRPLRHVGLHASPPRMIHHAPAHSRHAGAASSSVGSPSAMALLRTRMQPRHRARSRRAPARGYAVSADADHHHSSRAHP